jgi:hypothetical protein
MTKEPDSRFMLSAGHFPATFGTFLTGFDAVIHTADLLAAQRTCLTDFGTDLAKTMRKFGATELQISRCLADLGAADHETEVFRLDVLSAGLEAVVHCGLQADLMTMTTSLYTGLHGVFSMSWLFHEILLR